MRAEPHRSHRALPGKLILSSLSIAASALFLTGCLPGNRLTKANVNHVAEGMTKKQVESILGAPTSIDSKDFVVLKKTTYVYRQGNDSVTVVFKDDKVESKESTLSE